MRIERKKRKRKTENNSLRMRRANRLCLLRTSEPEVRKNHTNKPKIDNRILLLAVICRGTLLVSI